LAFSPNCSLLLGFQDARHKKNAFSGSRRALESFFHNATVAGIPADGRFINAALRYYGDDITAPLTAWKSDIHPASDQGSPDEPSQSKEHAWCAGASFLSSSCSCDNSRSSSRQMWTTTRIMQPDHAVICGLQRVADACVGYVVADLAALVRQPLHHTIERAQTKYDAPV
jgi:hypothetical protein